MLCVWFLHRACTALPVWICWVMLRGCMGWGCLLQAWVLFPALLNYQMFPMLGSHSVVIRALSLLGSQELWGIKGAMQSLCKESLGTPFFWGSRNNCGPACGVSLWPVCNALGHVPATSELSVVPVNNGGSLCVRECLWGSHWGTYTVLCCWSWLGTRPAPDLRCHIYAPGVHGPATGPWLCRGMSGNQCCTVGSQHPVKEAQVGWNARVYLSGKLWVSQNYGMGQVGRDQSRASGPASLLRQGHLRAHGAGLYLDTSLAYCARRHKCQH